MSINSAGELSKWFALNTPDEWTVSVWVMVSFTEQVEPERQFFTIIDAFCEGRYRKRFSYSIENNIENPNSPIRIGSFIGDELGHIPTFGHGSVPTSTGQQRWVNLNISSSGAVNAGSDWSGQIDFRWVVDGYNEVFSSQRSLQFDDVRLREVRFADLSPNITYSALRVFDIRLNNEQLLNNAFSQTLPDSLELFNIANFPLENLDSADIDISAYDVQIVNDGYGAGIAHGILPPFISDGYIGTALDFAKIHITGHSLTDGVGAMLDSILSETSLGYDWTGQAIPGSLIRVRTAWNDIPSFNWRGYTEGSIVGTSSNNLIDEFRHPGEEYTHLVIAERHDILNTIVWENTVRFLRHYYELVKEGSPNVLGYFYADWLGFDYVTISQWLQYARSAQVASYGVVGRINASLELEDRSDRMICIPTCYALAEVLERAITEPGLDGITVRDGGVINETDTKDVLFSDLVHLTDTGRYILACTVFSTVYRRNCSELPTPVGVNENAAQNIREIVWQIVLEDFSGQPLGVQLMAEESQQAVIDHVPDFILASGNSGASSYADYFAGTESDMYFNGTDSSITWYEAPMRFNLLGSGVDYDVDSITISNVDCYDKDLVILDLFNVPQESDMPINIVSQVSGMGLEWYFSGGIYGLDESQGSRWIAKSDRAISDGYISVSFSESCEIIGYCVNRLSSKNTNIPIVNTNKDGYSVSIDIDGQNRFFGVYFSISDSPASVDVSSNMNVEHLIRHDNLNIAVVIGVDT